MSAEKLSRERGVILHCNYDGCKASMATASTLVSAVRGYAASVGWIRGLRKRSSGSAKTGTGQKANLRWDICPGCAPAERLEAAQRMEASAERRAKRDASRKAKDAKTKDAP